MSKVTITTESDLEKVAKTAFYILANLRMATVKWQNDHGVATKGIKLGWEERADEFLRNPLIDKKFHADSGLEFDKPIKP